MLQTLTLDDLRWMDFIHSRREAHIFHHPCWLKNLEQVYGYRGFFLALLNKEGQVSAGLPMMEVSSPLTGRRWVSVPFSDHCAPLYEGKTALEELTSGLVDLAAQKAIPRMELRWSYPAREKIYCEVQHVWHTRQLDANANPDILFEGLSKKVRKYVRSSINRGVRVEIGSSEADMRRFYTLMVQTRQQHGVPVQPWRYFAGLQRNLLAQGLGFILLAYHEDTCLSGIVALHWQNTLTLKYGASLKQSEEDLRELRPGYLLEWEALRWACENGYTMVDVGRSGLQDEGLRDYKNRWGYQEQPLAYCSIGGKLSYTAPGRLMRLMNGVIRHSPAIVCRVAGELLYRHFG